MPVSTIFPHSDREGGVIGCVLGGVSNRIVGRAMRAPTVSSIVNQLKGYTTKQAGFPLWQKSFHDHIIRNEREYQKIWEYIVTNPLNWENDCFYNNKSTEKR